MNAVQKRHELEKHIASKIYGFAIIDKRKSIFMRTIACLLFFAPKFLTHFVTSIGRKVYVPELPWNPNMPRAATRTLAHEYQHLSDMRAWRLVPFCIMYLFPQILAFFAILAFFFGPWFLLFLLFLAPWPSITRAWLEYRGYRMTIYAHYWLYNGTKPNFDRLADNFVTSSYYWMFPFHKFLVRRFLNDFNNVSNFSQYPTKEIEAVSEILLLN